MCWKQRISIDLATASGSHSDKNQINYNAQDIRFTTKGSDLYAICLAWSDSSILIQSLDKLHVKDLKIQSVTMLGSTEKISWKQTDKWLQIRFPKVNHSKKAASVGIRMKLSGKDFEFKIESK